MTIDDIFNLIRAGKLQSAIDAIEDYKGGSTRVRNYELIRGIFLGHSSVPFLALEALKRELKFFADNTHAQQYLTVLQQELNLLRNSSESDTGISFSLILPIRSYHTAWELTLRSIACQAYQNIEILIAHKDLSTQEQEEICTLDHRIRFIKVDDTSLSEMIDAAIQVSTGEYQMVISEAGTIFTQTGIATLGQLFAKKKDIRFVTGTLSYLTPAGLPCDALSPNNRWSRKALLNPAIFTPPMTIPRFGNTIWHKAVYDEGRTSIVDHTGEAYEYELFLTMIRQTPLHTINVPLSIRELQWEGRSEYLSPRYVSGALTSIEREARLFPISEKDTYAPDLIRIEMKSHGNKLEGQSKLVRPLSPLTIFTEKLFQRYAPKISLVTPCFNQEDFIEETLHSVLSQNYPNLEYIVLDGGSSDRSCEIIKRYEKHLHFWRSEPDGGQYFALQNGLLQSSGEIMSWINSDDQLTPFSLHYVGLIFLIYPHISWLTGCPAAILETGALSPSQLSRAYSRENFLTRGFDRPFIQQEGTFWRRSLWEKAGGSLDLRYKLAADTELWRRFYRHAPLFQFEEHLALFRFRHGQRSYTQRQEYMQEAESILQEESDLTRRGVYPEFPPPPAPLTAAEVAAVSEEYFANLSRESA